MRRGRAPWIATMTDIEIPLVARVLHVIIRMGISMIRSACSGSSEYLMDIWRTVTCKHRKAPWGLINVV
jgi:hypothetical protein